MTTRRWVRKLQTTVWTQDSPELPTQAILNVADDQSSGTYDETVVRMILDCNVQIKKGPGNPNSNEDSWWFQANPTFGFGVTGVGDNQPLKISGGDDPRITGTCAPAWEAWFHSDQDAADYTCYRLREPLDSKGERKSPVVGFPPIALLSMFVDNEFGPLNPPGVFTIYAYWNWRILYQRP